MDEIYANNTQNLIYLGKGHRSDRRGLSIIAEILQSARQETNDYKSWSAALLSESGEYKYSDTGIELIDDLDPLFALFSAPWFGRLWVSTFCLPLFIGVEVRVLTKRYSIRLRKKQRSHSSTRAIPVRYKCLWRTS